VSPSRPQARRRDPRGAVSACLLLATAALAGVLLGRGQAAGTSGYGMSVRVIGTEQSVFDYSTQHCPDYRLPHITGSDGPTVPDIPDQPARAFRTADGRVVLIASNRVARRMVGPDLNHLRHRCKPALVSPYLGDDASSYAWRLWLSSPYTPDGKHVYALLHSEYHGNSNLPATVANCPSQSKKLCWYNAITLASSADSGRRFSLVPDPPGNLVASAPYPYDPLAGRRVGYFTISNIVRRGRRYFALMTAQSYRAQRRGTCLIRTRHLADPTSWRAWNGHRFGVHFIDPYRDLGADPAKHVCQPVSPGNLKVTAQSLVYSTYLRRYIAVDAGTGRDARGEIVHGVFFATSRDLIHWTKRQPLWQQQIFNNWRRGDPNPIGYASLLDPHSRSRNFNTVGRTPFLYFVRDQWDRGQLSNRNLHRIRLEFRR
jgi:hypothetical protein